MEWRKGGPPKAGKSFYQIKGRSTGETKLTGIHCGDRVKTQIVLVKCLFHFHLIFIISLWGKNYYVCFANRETETWRNQTNVPKFPCSKVPKSGFNSDTSWPHCLRSFYCIFLQGLWPWSSALGSAKWGYPFRLSPSERERGDQEPCATSQTRRVFSLSSASLR